MTADKSARDRMEKVLQALRHQFSRIRTGRPNPSLLEGIQIEYYGTLTNLDQVGQIGISESPPGLTITPWEKTLISAIEKAIQAADLGLNPANNGDTVRVPLPPLTEQRRQELARIIRQEAEKGRVALRNIRRDSNAELKRAVRDKLMSQDEERTILDRVQKLTDEFIAKIDQETTQKTQELTTF